MAFQTFKGLADVGKPIVVWMRFIIGIEKDHARQQYGLLNTTIA